MIKYALPVAVLYFGVVSTAVAVPGSTATHEPERHCAGWE
jgi:hypothetical protein